MHAEDTIDATHFFLRGLVESDISPAYVDGLNDPEVNRFLVKVKRCPQTMETVKAYIRANIADPQAVLTGLFHKDAAEPLFGTVRLSGICAYHHTADIGICLFHKSMWGHGYGREALAAFRSYAFDRLGLHYLEAGVYAGNTASLKAFQHSGFDEVCRLRNKYRLEDRFTEVVFFAAVNPDFDMRRLID